MDNLANIIATLDQPALLESLVEGLANSHYDTGYSRRSITGNWQVVETSSTQAYVRGTLSFSPGNDDARVNMPFLTSMFFTCVKGREDRYRLLWSSSLS